MISAVFALQPNSVSAQCPGCIIDQTCGVGINPVEPTLCPASLPNGTQGVYYDEKRYVLYAARFR